MADVAVAPRPMAHGKAPKKAKAASKGEKKAKKPSTHPPVNDMVVAALKALKERHGTSLQAVKKYVGANYQCDLAKLSPFIKKALKNGVAKGALVQTKGTGASGSFKLKVKPKAASGEKAKKKAAGSGEKKKVAKKPAKKLTAGVAKPKKAKSSPARAGGAKKKATAAGKKQKSTKHSKSVAKKPKAPKPKKASGASKKPAKK